MNYNYKLTFAYDGTAYHGWQIQPNGLSIQEIIQTHLQTILRKEKVVLIGSGRTDAGVHAHGQVAHFRHDEELDLRRLLYSLNGLLPRDIRLLKVENVPIDFHSQYSAIGKEYHYHLYLDDVLDPFRRLYVWHLHYKVDRELMQMAARSFVGTHDFTTFANEAHEGTASKDPVRNLYRFDLIDEPGGIRLEFEGDGFLYKMVRNITGTLVEIGKGKKAVNDVEQLFQARDRREAGQAAPPQGLFLKRVIYPS